MPEEKLPYLKMVQEFHQKYKNEILPVIQKHEITRKKELITAIIISGTLFLIACVLSYWLYKHYKAMKFGIITYIISAITGYLYLYSYQCWFALKKSFENSMKEKIMPVVCSCFGDLQWTNGRDFEGDLLYMANLASKIVSDQSDNIFLDFYTNEKILSASHIISEFTTKKYDDIFYGSYKNVNLKILEAKYITKSDKSSEIVFNGVIIKFDMNKPFKSHTIIKSHNLKHQIPLPNLHYTELEDIEFNKKFDVFTDDEVDARYLITPSFMERLKNIKTAFKVNTINCAFFNQFLFIAIPTEKDSFSICSLLKPIDDGKQYFQMYEEIISIIKLIDHFKLDQKIGL